MNASACPFSNLKFFRGILPLLVVVFGCELGESPLAPKISPSDSPETVISPDSAGNYMRIRALRPTLQASSNDSSQIEVALFDGKHNPLIGKEVTFSADGGTISSKDTSDEYGVARAVFFAEPANKNVAIQASMNYNGTTIRVATTVTLTGVSIDVTPSQSSAPLNHLVTVKVTLLDGKGIPLPDRSVRLTGNGDSTKTTDGQGVVSTVVLRTTPGTVALKAIALGAVDSATIDFGLDTPVANTNRYMHIRATPSSLSAGYEAASEIVVTVYDDNRNPVTGREISFTSTVGIITARSTTDSAGTASARFTAEPVNGNVFVYAKMKQGDSLMSVATTVSISGITLMVIPQLSQAPPGSVIPVRVKLLDGRGDPLPDRQIRITGNGDSVKTSDGKGEVATAVSNSATGTVIIRASALGASDSARVYFGDAAPVDSDFTIRSLRLFTSNSQVRADNSSTATITAIIISEDNHNPLIGDTVRFSSSLGSIDKYGITDISGRTSVTLRSAPINGTCLIRAVLTRNSDISDSTRVLFSGVTLELSVDRKELRINDTAIIHALLKDGSANPISSDAVNFSIGEPGLFAGATRLATTTLDAAGTADIKITSGTAGKIWLHAASANVLDSIQLSFTTNNLSVSATPAQITVGGSDSTMISARYLDISNNPLSGKTITFATSAGNLTSTSSTTNGNGIATTWLKSGYFATEATLQAKSSDGSAYTSVRFNAAVPKSIELAVTPDNIGVNGGIATLIASVKDDSGNVVTGADVSFKILKGPGGGEMIDKPIIVSTNDGIARTHLLAGSLPSTYRGCEIEVSVTGIKATSKLTISGEPYIITISRPESDTVKVPNGGTMGENTFSAFVGAVVSDVNGNPVADGTPVNFSTVVSGMAVGIPIFERWSGTGSTEEMKPILRWEYIDIPFEDVNNNRRMDPGIDLMIDDNNEVAARGDDINSDGRVDYSVATHDFRWFFSGSEPYWPASKEYFTITDPNDRRYRAPDTSIVRQVKTNIIPVIHSDGEKVVYDTTFLIIHDTTVRMNIAPTILSTGVKVGYDTTITIERDTTVRMHISPTISSGNHVVTYDTTYSYVYLTTVLKNITASILTGNQMVSYDTSYSYDYLTTVQTNVTPTVRSGISKVSYDTSYSYVNDTNIVYPHADSTYTIYADLNRNGKWDWTPLTTDRDGDGIYDGPASNDFEFWRWELRPQFKGNRIDFSNNDFAVVIDKSVTTTGGVASTKITYPRQFANRLIATVNAEVKGIRDRDGERFVLPVVRD